MNFQQYWNSQDLDKYRSTEDYCRASWNNCRLEIISLLHDRLFKNNNTSKNEMLLDIIEEIKKEI